MNDEIGEVVSELKSISDSLYQAFKLSSTLLEDYQFSHKINPDKNSNQSLENYIKRFLSDVVLKKIFGEYLK